MNAVDYAKYADIALASYSTINSAITLKDSLQAPSGADFTTTQASLFINNWSLVAPTYSDPTSDFQATLFQEKLPGGGAGKLVLGLRGTESTHDLAVTDAQIATQGVAFDQIVAIYNYVQQLKTATNAISPQYELVMGFTGAPPTNGILAGSDPLTKVAAYLVPAAGVPGLGKIPPGTQVDVTGHSLGGHLAMAFDRLFPELTGNVFTYNAPGFKDTPMVNDFFSVLAGRSTYLETGKITNIVADQAANGTPAWAAIAGLHSRPGTLVDVPIENQLDPALFGDLIGKWNHSQKPLTDALNLQAAFTKLDPSLSTPSFANLFKAGANNVPQSMEGTLDGLRVLFIGTDALTTRRTEVGDREGFYANLKALIDPDGNPATADGAFNALAGKLILRAADRLTGAAARNDFGALLSLITLSPVWLSGKDAAADALLQNAVKTNWNTEYTNWAEDKSPTDPKHVPTYSDSWLKDRAALLQALKLQNTQDNTTCHAHILARGACRLIVNIARKSINTGTEYVASTCAYTHVHPNAHIRSFAANDEGVMLCVA